MPMKHTKVNRSWRNSCFWARGCCVLTYPCLSKFNLLKMFLKHSPNLYVSQRPLWMGTLPDILPPFPLICASTLGNAPATCCCLASELRFCSSKALELPRRNHWGAESFGGVGRGCLFLSHHFPPKKMGRHLNHFDPENIGMYLSFFFGGVMQDPTKMDWNELRVVIVWDTPHILWALYFGTHHLLSLFQDASRTGGCGLIERLLLTSPLVFFIFFLIGGDMNLLGSTYCTLLLLSA